MCCHVKNRQKKETAVMRCNLGKERPRRSSAPKTVHLPAHGRRRRTLESGGAPTKAASGRNRGCDGLGHRSAFLLGGFAQSTLGPSSLGQRELVQSQYPAGARDENIGQTELDLLTRIGDLVARPSRAATSGSKGFAFTHRQTEVEGLEIHTLDCTPRYLPQQYLQVNLPGGNERGRSRHG